MHSPISNRTTLKELLKGWLPVSCMANDYKVIRKNPVSKEEVRLILDTFKVLRLLHPRSYWIDNVSFDYLWEHRDPLRSPDCALIHISEEGFDFFKSIQET